MDWDMYYNRIWLDPVWYALSLALTGLMFYQRLVLILLHATVSFNRACAVYAPLQYTKIFTRTRTKLLPVLGFLICLPVLVAYSIPLFGCVYYFEPYSLSWMFDASICNRVHTIAEYVCHGVILSFSIVVDFSVAAYLFRDRKKQGRNMMDFMFIVQTLVLALSNGFFTLFLYTIGTLQYFTPLLDHMAKLNNILLALIYTATIALCNKHVRTEIFNLITCKRNARNIGTVLVVVTSNT
ncbi:hypothetical protein Y032_0144g2444 [Ancylostoma ceylanicum]|uniref:7TM GPCR serpentine receptor class x (Srx) domain-containing protein n=1 Tax=Ancylostoma ceylanicum TaxID=53326 RepID=A0A016T2S9_9BILA|nr:hypothetical protein Y032_0144g2444 [Ancylostoma ceylanicum]